MKPERIQLSRRKGWRLPPHSVVVARPTKWGNPFRVGADGDAKMCVALFRTYIRSAAPIAEQISELRGKNLACWCKPGQPCHADVLIEIANENKP